MSLPCAYVTAGLQQNSRSADPWQGIWGVGRRSSCLSHFRERGRPAVSPRRRDPRSSILSKLKRAGHFFLKIYFRRFQAAGKVCAVGGLCARLYFPLSDQHKKTKKTQGNELRGRVPEPGSKVVKGFDEASCPSNTDSWKQPLRIVSSADGSEKGCG